MSGKRAHILTIGGFDPSGGAGVLADIKTFEQHKLLGMAVNTANTVQTEDRFEAVNWLSEELILGQLDTLLAQYSFDYVKIGLIPSVQFIGEISQRLSKTKPCIIWDPILKASAGFDMEHATDKLLEVLDTVFLITPNWEEVQALTGMKDAIAGAKKLAQNCNVYLKGGHNAADPGRDYLFIDGREYTLRPRGRAVSEKHGSGCVLSSALAANLTQRYPMVKACLRSKEYVTRVLESNPSLLGYHKG